MIMKTEIEKGDIYYASLDSTIGSEQKGERPVVVIQNNEGNKYNPTVIVAPLTKILKKTKLPTHIFIQKNYILRFDSQILLEQTRVIDKTRLINYLGTLENHYKQLIDNALIETFSIDIIGYLKSKGIGENNNDSKKQLYSQYYYKKNKNGRKSQFK